MKISIKHTKKKSEKADGITFCCEQQAESDRRLETVRRLILWALALLLLISFGGVTLTLFQIPCYGIILGLWSGICLGICFFCYDKVRLRRGFILAAVLLFVLVVLLGGELFRDGLGIVLNGLKDLWGAAFRLIYLRSAVSGYYSDKAAVTVFLLPVVVVASVLVSYVVLGRGRVMLFLILLSLFVLLIPAITSPFWLWYIFLFLALVVLSFVGVSGIVSRKNAGKAFLFTGGVFALITLVICLLPLTGILPNGYGKPEVCSAVEKSLAAFGDRVRWGSDQTNNLPEGHMESVSSLEREEKPALEVTMSDPCSLYLRGYVGSVYSEDGWTSVDKKALYEYADLFYWLHNSGFYGMSQLSAAAEAVGRDAEEITVTVRNLEAKRKYIYSPYEYVENGTGLAASRIGDESPRAADYEDSENVTYTIVSNQVKTAVELGQSIREHAVAGDEETLRYLENEQAYRAFVYDTLLSIPKETLSVLKSHLGEVDLSEGHAAYDDAMQAILDELLTNTAYNEEVAASEDAIGFFRDFLESNGEGYSVHYATAAALMFRYYGIPSRYVEGYIITPRDVAGVKAGEPIEVSGENAHAWVEYYRDGVGWIPFEVTPPYLFVMERPDQIKEQVSDTLDAQSNQQGMVNMDQDNYEDIEEEENKNEKDDEDSVSFWVYVLIAVSLVLLLLLSAFVVLCLRRRKEMRRRRKELASADDRLAVDLLFRDILRLLSAGGLKRENGSLENCEGPLKSLGGEGLSLRFGMAVRLHREAIFSDHPISSQRRYVFSLFRKEAKAFAKGHSRFVKRWIDRYIRHLY